MKILDYEIQKGDTLESIAAKHNISVNDLVAFHNQNCGITQLIIGNELSIVINYIFIDAEYQKKIKIENYNQNEHSTFEQKTRYRCEQINTTKINGILAHFMQQNFQYVVKYDKKIEVYHVQLEDYIFETNPTYLTPSFNFISKTEFIKHNVLFNIFLDSGRLFEILNKQKILDDWEKFKKNKLYEDDFILQLSKTNTKSVEELIKMGDTQFSLDYKLTEEEYRRNLFYFIMFDKFLVEDIDNITIESFDFMSTILPPVIIPLEFRYDKISEKNNILKFRKVGEAKLDDQLISEITQKYDEIHKPNIKFNFTEYKLTFRVRGEFNKITREMETADLFIIEQIADNIENQCEFHLKKLNNFTS